MPQIHLAAVHAAPGYRTSTPGLGVLCRADEELLGAGILNNSVGKTSRYAFAGWQPWQWGPVRVGAIAGVMDGYDYHDGGYFPMAMAVLTWDTKIGAWHVTAVPKVGGLTEAALALSYSFHF